MKRLSVSVLLMLVLGLGACTDPRQQATTAKRAEESPDRIPNDLIPPPGSRVCRGNGGTLNKLVQIFAARHRGDLGYRLCGTIGSVDIAYLGLQGTCIEPGSDVEFVFHIVHMPLLGQRGVGKGRNGYVQRLMERMYQVTLPPDVAEYWDNVTRHFNNVRERDVVPAAEAVARGWVDYCPRAAATRPRT